MHSPFDLYQVPFEPSSRRFFQKQKGTLCCQMVPNSRYSSNSIKLIKKRAQKKRGNENPIHFWQHEQTVSLCLLQNNHIMLYKSRLSSHPFTPLRFFYRYGTCRIVSVCLKQMDTFYHSICYNARAVLTTISHTDRKMHDLLPGQLPAPCIRLAASNIDVICARI